jgi:hypothetical protein
MARIPDHPADGLDPDNSGGWVSGFLAEEDDLDRRSLWRLGSWGAGSVAAVVVAILANQSSIGLRRDQIASADLTRQSQQIQSVAKESQTEARRLASAIDTLNGDRDRLYSRVTVLEQGLDSVTGSIARQNSAAGSPQPASSRISGLGPASQDSPPVAAIPATTVAALTDKPRDVIARQPQSVPPATSAASADAKVANLPAVTPATPLMPSKSMMAPPDPAATKLIEPEQPPEVIMAAPVPEVAAVAAEAPDSAPSKAVSEIAVQRTEFGVDLGGATSIDGLRILWRGLLKSNTALTALRPLIVVRERNSGPGMQLRLVAGPLSDAAAAAKICAALIESERPCETAVFDGQRLAMKSDDPAPSARPPRKRVGAKRASVEEQPPKSKGSPLPLLGTR